MSNYTITTNFGAKDSLPSTDAGKVIKGSEFTTEFTNIQTAIATKADTAGDTFTGAVTFDAAVTLNADVTFDTNTLFIDVSANKVGIGNTSPAYELDVTGSAQLSGGDLILRSDSDNADTQYIRFENYPTDIRTAYIRADYTSQTAGGGTALAFGTNDHATATDTDSMVIDIEGNVGIGTTSPSSKLHVSTGTDTDAGNIAFTIGGTSTSNARTASITKNTSTPYELTIQAGNHATSNMETVFKSSDSKETMRIDSSGNVGIGTDSPDTQLHVFGSGSGSGTYGAQITIGKNNGCKISSTQESTDDDKQGLAFFTKSSSQVADSAVERLRIDELGNVGIGTTSPDVKLDVTEAYDTVSNVLSNGSYAAKFSSSGSGDTGRTQGILLSGQDGNARGVALLAEAQSTSNAHDFVIATSGASATPTERMRIDSSGNVLVGKTSSGSTIQGAELHNSGSIFSVRDSNPSGTFDRKTNDGDVVQFRRDGTTVGSVSATSSATSYNTSSDERLKENITDSADAGSKVDAIQIRQFDWKANGSHQDYGVIAQELVTVAPEAVSEGDTEEDMMGVDYSKLVPMLIKEVQSLRSRVAELENV